MTRTSKLLLIAASVLATALAVPTSARSQPGYAGYGGRITCSSNDGRRNWCDIGRSRDVQLVRQISGSACIRNNTWGVDGRGLWVDKGCRADFAFRQAGPPTPTPAATINCSSNDGRRNWCDIGRARDARLVRQISGSACIRNNTWGVDGRGLWVDKGCRADFAIVSGGYGPPPGPPPPQIVTCSSNDGRRNWCDTGGRRDIRLNRQISGSACIQGQTWGVDNRGLWVDKGCRAEFRVR